ncbi:MAG: DUF1993 domain-containing protein [Leptolyngbya sp. SIOISBB]|nr:DUF1993 domain-containing protein [Leptolyngbya sp. SIOISBB]
MATPQIEKLKTIFSSRLDNLSHFLDLAETHFAADIESLLQRRLAPDMLPFGTQIVFTCNQPRNFALWCTDQPMDNLPPEVDTLAAARDHIASTKALLAGIDAVDAKLATATRIPLGPEMYLDLSGQSYVDDFLMPNFYFHLTTAYDIMRMAGAPIGKRDYMMHLVPLLKQQDGA